MDEAAVEGGAAEKGTPKAGARDEGLTAEEWRSAVRNLVDAPAEAAVGGTAQEVSPWTLAHAQQLAEAGDRVEDDELVGAAVNLVKGVGKSAEEREAAAGTVARGLLSTTARLNSGGGVGRAAGGESLPAASGPSWEEARDFVEEWRRYQENAGEAAEETVARGLLAASASLAAEQGVEHTEGGESVGEGNPWQQVGVEAWRRYQANVREFQRRQGSGSGAPDEAAGPGVKRDIL